MNINNFKAHILNPKLFSAIFFLLVFALHAQNFVQHVVADGESIRSISKKYKVAPSEIYRYNTNIKFTKEHKLASGQVLRIATNEKISQITSNVKTMKLDGKIADYKYHTVRENETIYSLSKKYDTSIENIVKANHIEGANIKLGQILIIPVSVHENSPKPVNSDKYVTYIVGPKEGKWRVAYNHHITIDELERLNPEIKEKKLQVHQELLVPKYSVSVSASHEIQKKPSYIFHEVMPKETMYSLSKTYHISPEDLVKFNPELTQGLKTGQKIRIPVQSGDSLTKAPDYQDEPVEIQPETINLLDSLDFSKEYKIAILLPFNLKKIAEEKESEKVCRRIQESKILDYYSGIKMAVDSMKTIGMQIKTDVFDTQKSPFVTQKILETTDLSDYDFVIGPIKKENIEKVAMALETENTPVVVHKYDGEQNFRNLVVSTTTNDYLKTHIINYLKDQAFDKALSIVYDDPKKKPEIEAIAQQFDTPVTLIEGKETKKGFSIYQSQILSKLSKNKENYVVLASDDDSFIFSVLSTLNSVANTYKVTLFTLDDKRLYENDTNDRMNMYLSNLRYHFPTKMKRMIDVSFQKKYEQKYNIIPNFTVINGFDTGFDLLLRVGNADNLLEGLQKIGKTAQSSKVYLYRHSHEGGFKNQASVILMIDKDLSLKMVE